MQRHVSNNQDAVIESPLHLLLLIKLLIAFCPFFSLQTAGLRKKNCRKMNLRRGLRTFVEGVQGTAEIKSAPNTILFLVKTYICIFKENIPTAPTCTLQVAPSG